MTIGTSSLPGADLVGGGTERYLYAVVPAGTVPSPGALGSVVDDAGIDLVTEDGLAAVVGPVPQSTAAVAASFGRDSVDRPEHDDAGNAERTLAVLESAVRDHERVVEQILAHATSMVPFRFGTVLASTGAVRDLLRDHAEELGACLAALRGRREWGLVVEWEGEAALQAAQARANVTGGPEAETAGPGHRFFAAKRSERAMADALRACCADLAGELEDALGTVAAALRLRHGADRREGPKVCVLVASVLVAEADDERFSAALESLLGLRHGLSATMSGPWPPYSFVGPLPMEAP